MYVFIALYVGIGLVVSGCWVWHSNQQFKSWELAVIFSLMLLLWPILGGSDSIDGA